MDKKALAVVKLLDDLKINPYYHPFETNQKSTTLYKGKKSIILGSNDYLGLSQSKEGFKKAKEAINKYGLSTCGARISTGTAMIHNELEESLRRLTKKEGMVLFTTGMLANMGSITCLGRDKIILSDRSNHASIIDAIKMTSSKMSIIYNHNDMEDLENKLKQLPLEAEKLIITDGVFSMSGAIVNLPKLVELKKKYNFKIFLDDAHGLGVLGHNGLGTADHFNLVDEVDYYLGVNSKTLAGIGGFLGCTKEEEIGIKYSARAIMYTAALPPSVVAGVKYCVDALISGNTGFENLRKNIDFFKKEIKKNGLRVIPSDTAIQAILVNDDKNIFKLVHLLKEDGVFVMPVIAPMVEPGVSLLRCSVTAIHKQKDLRNALKKIKFYMNMLNLE